MVTQNSLFHRKQKEKLAPSKKETTTKINDYINTLRNLQPGQQFSAFVAASTVHEESLNPNDLKAYRQACRNLMKARGSYFSDRGSEKNAEYFQLAIDAYNQIRQELKFPKHEEFQLKNQLIKKESPRHKEDQQPSRSV